MGLVAVLFVLAAGAFSQAATEAAPPDPYAGLDVTVSLTTDCKAIVSWSELRGGKPIFIQVRLSYNDGDGDGNANDFVPSTEEGANGIYKVHQNDGHFELDLSGPAAGDPMTLHRITVRFENRRGAVLGPVPSYQAEADCAIG
jgi:hypothetical protein